MGGDRVGEGWIEEQEEKEEEKKRKEVEPVDRSTGRIPKNQRVKRDLPVRTNQIWPKKGSGREPGTQRSLVVDSGEDEEPGKGLSPTPRNSSSGRSINRGRGVHDADLLLEHPRVNVEALSNRTPLHRECSRRLTFHRSIVPSCPKAFAASRGR